MQASTSSLGDSVVKVEAPAAESAASESAPAEAEAPAAESTPDAPTYAEVASHAVNGDAAPADSVSSLPPPPVDTALANAEKTPDSPPTPIADPRSKLEIWTEIKLLSVSRTIASVYVLALLVLQTRVQLNVLGRRSYLASVRTLASKSAAVPVHEDDLDAAFSNAAMFADSGAAGELAQTERDYLALSWWLLHRGWADVVARVREAVADVFGPVALKSSLTQADLAGLIERVRRQVEGAEPSLVPATIFPSDPADQLDVLTQATGGSSTALSADLRALLDETADLLESPDLPRVFRACIDALHAQLLASLDPLFGARSADAAAELSADQRFAELPDLQPCRLANLLPAIARQSALVLDSLANPYLDVRAQCGTGLTSAVAGRSARS